MEMEVGCVEQFFAPQTDSLMSTVRQMKNGVIGNNRHKTELMALGVVPRLLQLMADESAAVELRTECSIVLGSLAKGTEQNIRGLVDAGSVPALLKGLFHPNQLYVEACARCLRTLYLSQHTSIQAFYQDSAIVPHMISIISMSPCTQECVTTILANICRGVEHQATLCSNGAISALAPLLTINNVRIQMPTLRCFAMLCHQNPEVSASVAMASYDGVPISSLIVRLLTRDKSSEMQMAAAKCLTYLCRAGALDPDDPVICFKTLSALVRLCENDMKWEERVEGAELLGYLIEVDLNLQQTAAITDRIITTLAEYYKYPGSPPDTALMPTKKDDIVVGNELRQAAFRAYASLAANDEDIRKKIIETENLMEHIVNGLSDPVTKVQIAAIRCLHSLSRSVQQLRTNFQDHIVWKPIIKILHNPSDEVLVVASSTLCNLLLEFSPSKEPIVQSGIIDLLVELSRREESTLRLNAIWALMNMTFQCDNKISTSILSSLGSDQLFRLLSDPDLNILMKTLGLMRNLLSNKPHIDQVMSMHGAQVMQAVTLILEGDHPAEVKEQALCILANVADGDSAKDCIMSNQDILRKLINYMIHSNVKLQIAATFCLSNLVWNEDEGAAERQAKLKELGIQKLLQQLLGTNDTTLFDRVKTALQQF